MNPGERIFDIYIQGRKVTEEFDIVNEAGKPDKEVVKQYYGIKAGQTLKVNLNPLRGNTLISGIELIQESLTVQ